MAGEADEWLPVPPLLAPPHGLTWPQTVGGTAPPPGSHQAHSALKARRRPIGVFACVWLYLALCFPNLREQRPHLSPSTCYHLGEHSVGAVTCGDGPFSQGPKWERGHAHGPLC